MKRKNQMQAESTQTMDELKERVQLEMEEDIQTEKAKRRQQRREVFSVKLEKRDIIVAAAAGVVCGALGGCFKSYVPKSGPLKHKHSTTRTAVDYKVPKPEGRKGSVQGLHRQFGPGHDIGRWQEALDLMSGKTNDFPLWGKSIAERTGGVLHTGNIRLDEFLKGGGFRIPADPKKELMSHLVIDFFTKTSLPIPYSSYIADYSELLANAMADMYEEGLNLKNVVGSGVSFLALQFITRGYVYLAKVLPQIGFYEKIEQVKTKKELLELLERAKEINRAYTRSKEFQVLQMVAQGVDFLLDSVITVTSKNYAGLFALNWGALLSCGINSTKHLSGRLKEYKKLKEETENIEMFDVMSE